MKKKPSVDMVLALDGPTHESEQHDEEHDMQAAKNDAADELLDAIKSSDRERFLDAFDTLLELCYAEHDEPDGDEDEDEDDGDEGEEY